MTGPKSLADLLHRSEHLKRLRAEAGKRRELSERIRAMLPPEEAKHLVSAHITPLDELILVLDSPAWAARMRYLHQGLREQLAPLAISRVRVQARPRR